MPTIALGPLVLVGLLGVFGLLGVPGLPTESFAHARKPARKAPAPTEKDISDALTAHQPEVQQCAVDHGIAAGAQAVDIVASLNVDGRGRVISCTVRAKMAGGQHSAVEGLEKCVDGVLRAIQFPRTNRPMIQIERTWTVSTG